jgi:hypothetical protein
MTLTGKLHCRVDFSSKQWLLSFAHFCDDPGQFLIQVCDRVRMSQEGGDHWLLRLHSCSAFGLDRVAAWRFGLPSDDVSLFLVEVP